ncbi:MAG TPA: hypothetical protein VK900_10180 [Anaerolineales bacterium]|nr:hypothetical protein [Anaerolineales bacterium]
MILTLLITLIVESPIAAGYAFWRRKPLLSILVTSVCGNLITQSLLWLTLNIFFDWYLAVLILAEVLIWILEGLLFYSVPMNQLHIAQAMVVSLLMNTASLALGWFLPV